ncbi:MAG: hypothetical protein ABIJ96_11510 [Elusimicrobiota bacterium]
MAEALESRGIAYAIAGGHALAFHGALRATYDIDIVIKLDKKNILGVEEALASIGLKSRQPINAEQMFNFRQEYIDNKNLKAWTFQNPSDSSEVIDIIITHDLKKMKSKKIQSGKYMLRVIAKKDLIAMKKAAGREQDIEDVKALQANS